jgi:Zn finger protein HypA/HybF involved in hydrogenase expression
MEVNRDKVTKETLRKLFKAARKGATETGAKILISQAPSDPKEKKKWVESMFRIQVAMWVDEGAKCAHCGHQYQSVDDFLARNPKQGYGEDHFVCNHCWDEYKAASQPSP